MMSSSIRSVDYNRSDVPFSRSDDGLETATILSSLGRRLDDVRRADSRDRLAPVLYRMRGVAALDGRSRSPKRIYISFTIDYIICGVKSTTMVGRDVGEVQYDNCSCSLRFARSETAGPVI